MDMKQHIARTAMPLFARRGHAGTSMREIAEAANLTKAALYHHYPDKDALYHAALADCAGRLCARIAESGEGIADPATKLRTMAHAHLQLFIDEADIIRALYHNLLTPDAAMELESRDDEDHPMMGVLRECAEAGYLDAARVEDAFILLVGGIEYSGVRWLMDPRAPVPSQELGDRLVTAAIPALEKTFARGPKARAARTGKRRVGRALALFVGGLAASGAGAQEPIAPLIQRAEPNLVEAIPGAPRAIDLDTCIAGALEANAALEAERRGHGELRGQKLQALADGLPSVDLVGSFSRSRDPSFALDETFGGGGDTMGDSAASFVIRPEDIPPQSFWRASLDARWEINPGRVFNAVGAANLGSRRQAAIVEGAEHRTVEATLTAYYGVLLAADAVDALAAEVRARMEFLDITRRRFAVDFATALDTLQAAVSLANIEPDHRRAELDLRNAGSELNVLMGLEPLSPLTIVRAVSVETDPVDPDRAVGLALERPDVRQLRLLERVFAKNRGAQKSESRPYVSLAGSYGYVARTFDTLGDEGKDSWRVSAALTVPIFDGLLTRGHVKETEARMARTRLDRVEAERRARLEVLTLAGELEVARDNLRAAKLNMSRAESALRVTTLTYENAKADYLSVLNAQADRFQARSNLIRARFEVLQTTASLKRAMGVSPMTPLRSALDDTQQVNGRN